MHQIGQKVCLWGEITSVPGSKKITAAREIIATVTEFTNDETLAIGDDQKTYALPKGTELLWYQLDAEGNPTGETLYDSARFFNEKGLKPEITLVNTEDQPIFPKGDGELCKNHPYFTLPGKKCFRCLMEEYKAKTVC